MGIGLVMDPQLGLGKRRDVEKARAGDFLNICVVMRNMLSRDKAVWFLLGAAAVLVVFELMVLAFVGWHRAAPVHLVLLLFIVVLLCLFFRVRTVGAAARRAVRQMAEIVREDNEKDSARLYSIWYKVNCCIDPIGAFVSNLL